MKIVFFMQDTGCVYGAERATLDLAAFLREFGHDVHFLLIEETRFNLGDGLREELKRRELPCFMLPCGAPLSLAVLSGLRAYIAAVSPDVIHAVGYKADVHLVLARLELPRPALVATVHGWLERPDWKERFYGVLDRWALRRFDGVVVLSRYYEERLLKARVSRERLVLIPHGLDTRRLPVLDKSYKGQENAKAFVFGMLGRLSWEKNHRLFLEAMASLKKRGHLVKAAIAGNGPLRSDLQLHVADLDLQQEVEWLGYIPSDEFFPKVQALVVCSWIENFPYSILEAMAWGIPVIATRVGGIPDLVVDGETGWLVPAGSASALVGAMEAALTDSAGAEARGRRGRERLERLFSLERTAKKHAELYQRLIKQ